MKLTIFESNKWARNLYEIYYKASLVPVTAMCAINLCTNWKMYWNSQTRGSIEQIRKRYHAYTLAHIVSEPNESPSQCCISISIQYRSPFAFANRKRNAICITFAIVVFLCSVSLRVAVESREKKLWGNYELQFLRYLNLPVNRTGSNERNKLIFIWTYFLLSNHFISDYSFFSSLFFFFSSVSFFELTILQKVLMYVSVSARAFVSQNRAIVFAGCTPTGKTTFITLVTL